MNCSSVKEELYGYRKGWLEDPEAAEVKRHLGTCSDCSVELDSLQDTLSPLSALPEVNSSETVWAAIEDGIREESPVSAPLAVVGASESAKPAGPEAPARRPRLVSSLITLAAAASIVVAVLSFVLLYSTTPQPAAFVDNGGPVAMHETFTAEQYTTLTIPEVGNLRLKPGTRIEFITRRHVKLHTGNAFADIQPSGRGFVMEGRDAKAIVHGTKFGLSTNGATRLYVVDGVVEFRNREGSVKVTADQVAVADPRPTLISDGSAPYVRWIADHETPTVLVEAEKGKTWTITIRTNAPAPVFLGSFRSTSTALFAHIRSPRGGEVALPIDVDNIRILKSLTGKGGHYRLDPVNPIRLSVTLEPGLFRDGRGTYEVAIGLRGSMGVQQRQLWVGQAMSLPLKLEID